MKTMICALFLPMNVATMPIFTQNSFALRITHPVVIAFTLIDKYHIVPIRYNPIVCI